MVMDGAGVSTVSSSWPVGETEGEGGGKRKAVRVRIILWATGYWLVPTRARLLREMADCKEEWDLGCVRVGALIPALLV